VRAELCSWAAAVGLDALRPVSSDSMHVTLAFLGWRSADEVGNIGEAVVEGVPADVVALSAGEPGWLPPRRPRVLAVDLIDDSGTLGRLQADVSSSLVRRAGFVPEKRPFRAHITVARVRRGARVRPRELDLSPVAGIPPGFAAPAVTLFRSHLSPNGPRYEPLIRCELPLG
jgi:2'-5' RNA ligase